MKAKAKRKRKSIHELLALYTSSTDVKLMEGSWVDPSYWGVSKSPLSGRTVLFVGIEAYKALMTSIDPSFSRVQFHIDRIKKV